MQFIDTHIHLQDYKSNSTPQIIRAAQTCGVIQMVCVSSRPQDWRDVAALAAKYSEIIPAFGVHPWYIADLPADWEEKLRVLLIQNPQAWVGEVGLDRLKNPAPQPQKEVFAAQIALARELNRPLSVHLLKAEMWLPEFVRDLKSLPWVWHSFAAAQEAAEFALKNGAYLSFSQGSVRSKHFAAVAAQVPAERILLESDGPYQPLTKGGESNPSYLPQLLKQIAAVRGEDENILGKQIATNSQRLINGNR